MTGLD